ncbi:MAG: zinc ribbon domain-containing protein [Zetaproteobacteria bacterium]|nr:zinc ribbon domain-containing protein [Zetaproteobacteria bacterium]
MPLYEFICRECDAHEEHLMRISDPNPTDCSVCGKSTLEKMLSRTHFVLKGSGWYETDFKEKPQRSSSADAGKTPEKPAENSTPKPEASAPSDGKAAATESTKPAATV